MRRTLFAALIALVAIALIVRFRSATPDSASVPVASDTSAPPTRVRPRLRIGPSLSSSATTWPR
jgi:hypothetical protein